jgi:hypothetical protein
MTNITSPKSNIPVGYVTVNGQRLEVSQHPEFVRFFFDLMRRVGGTDATDNTALQSALDQAELDIDALVLDVEAEQIAPLAQIQAQIEFADGRVSALEAELAALRVQVQGLLMGVTA